MDPRNGYAGELLNREHVHAMVHQAEVTRSLRGAYPTARERMAAWLRTIADRLAPLAAQAPHEVPDETLTHS